MAGALAEGPVGGDRAGGGGGRGDLHARPRQAHERHGGAAPVDEHARLGVPILCRDHGRRSRRLRRGRWRGCLTAPEDPGRVCARRERRAGGRAARRRRSWCWRSSTATGRVAGGSRRCWQRTGSSARSPVWPGCCAPGCIWARSTSASCTTRTLTRRSSRIAGCSSGCSGGCRLAGVAGGRGESNVIGPDDIDRLREPAKELAA